MSSPGRKTELQDTQHYAVLDNPVFKIKVKGLDNQFEQPASKKGRNVDQNKKAKKFKIGEKVKGISIKDGKFYSGKVVDILEDKEIIKIVSNKNESIIKLDATTCSSIDKKEDREEITDIEFTLENYILNYDEFLLEKLSSLESALRDLKDKNIPLAIAKKLIIYTGNLKYKWNKKIMRLSTKDIKALINIQKLVTKKYSEYEYILNWKGKPPEEIDQD